MSKVSAYNHFQPWRDGYYIAYNAFSGAVALMTEENYAAYKRLVDKLGAASPPELTEDESALLKQLEYGRFVNRGEAAEIDWIRMQHNLARYDQSTLGLVIAPTMACNMACEYCFEDHTASRMPNKTIEAIVSFVEKQAKTIGVLDISWYGGEPLLAMDVIEDLTESFQDLAEEYKFDYHASMISNGYKLTPDIVDRLVELGIGHVQVTLDGPARIHNKKRPLKNKQDSFDKIIENIQYASTKLSIGVRVNVDKSFTTEIIQELLDELKTADLTKRVGVYFGMVEPSTQVCANIAEACYETADFSKVEVEFYQLLLANGFRVERLPQPVSTFCMAQSTNSHLIDPEGFLYRCWNHAGDKERATGTIFEDVNYVHPNFQHLFAFSPFETERCTECNLLPICMGGCPSRRADRDLKDDQLCEAWKHNLQPMLEIIALSRQQDMQRQQEAQQQPEAQAAKE